MTIYDGSGERAKYKAVQVVAKVVRTLRSAVAVVDSEEAYAGPLGDSLSQRFNNVEHDGNTVLVIVPRLAELL